jgi:hypothetical protein
MQSRSRDFRENKPYYLPLLLIISFVSHFPFVLKGFGEIDATKIAVSVIDMLNHGPDAAFATYYFSDVIPLYILYLKWSMKLLNYDYSYLPVVMNYTNAVFGTLTVIPAFFLIRQLFRNSTIAFCTVLALIFAPSFYQSTIMGFPHLIAFFFLLVSLCFYLSGLDRSRKSTVYFFMFLSCMLLTVAFLFKSDIVLAAGIYIGFLFMRKEKDTGKITAAFLIIIVSGVLFLLFRNLIIGSSSGATMSKEGMSKWYEYSLIIPTNLTYLMRQVKPIAYGAGVVTFFLGIISFIYFLAKRRLDLIVFIVSWAVAPILFWLVMIGNNARHNMPATLPILAMIVIFLYDRVPKYVTVLTLVLILGNFYAVPPSFSILTPSGNLFKSNTLLEDRMAIFQSRAKEIADIDENKIAVLGYFHNPHVVFEIIRSSQWYKADKIGREDYRITTVDREFLFFYFVVTRPEDMNNGIAYLLRNYDLKEYVFLSATYDLKPLAERGLKTRKIDIIKRSDL